MVGTLRHNRLTHLAKKCDNNRGGGRYLRLGGGGGGEGGTNDGACISTHTLGVWRHDPPKFFKTRCSEITSEAIFVLKSGQFLL